MSLNSVTLMGRLTNEPEMRTTQNGTTVTTFTLAVDRDFQSGEKQTDFIDIVVWRKTAEFVASHWKKGQMMALQGKLQSRKWQDRDGNNRTNWEVVADSVWFCGDKKSENTYAGLNVQFEEEPNDDASGTLPF